MRKVIDDGERLFLFLVCRSCGGDSNIVGSLGTRADIAAVAQTNLRGWKNEHPIPPADPRRRRPGERDNDMRSCSDCGDMGSRMKCIDGRYREVACHCDYGRALVRRYHGREPDHSGRILLWCGLFCILVWALSSLSLIHI